MPVWGAPIKNTRYKQLDLYGNVVSQQAASRARGGYGAQVGARSIMSAVRSPTAAMGLGARLLASRLGAAALLPVIGMLLPAIIGIIQSIIKNYIDEELRRKYEKMRKDVYEQVYAGLKPELAKAYRAEYREAVSE